MYICEWKATYIMIKHDFWATEKIIFNGMLERNDLNYQPMTDRMTQCASELNQIKSFIFKTIVEYISTCTLSYMFCTFFRCGSTTDSFRFHFWIVYSWKYWWCIASERLLIYVALYVFCGGLSHLSFKAKFQKSNKEI